VRYRLDGELGRREFLKTLGGGILVCICPARGAAEERQSGRPLRRRASPQAIAAWLHVSQEGRITVTTGKVEVGQNIRTSLAQQVAEELRVPLEAIVLVMGDTERTPWDAGTFGSRTTPQMGPQLRAAAAAARELLLEIASARWKSPREDLEASEGRVTNPRTGQSVPYGGLTRGEALVKLIGDPPLAAPADWRVAGRPAAKMGGRLFVTGKHLYSSDLRRPGMLHGRILRPPHFGSKLLSLDSAKAAKVPGVRVLRDGELVGVVAPDPRAAESALSLLRAEWERAPTPPAPSSHEELFPLLKARVDAAASGFEERSGSLEEGFREADVELAQTYTVHYIAHAPLEPRAAVAEWSGDSVTVWTGTQRPFAVRDELAAAFGLPVENVRVLVPDTGAAYGGKHTGEAALEAARLSRAAGKPVRLVWSRREEFTWAYFRPAGLIEVRSGARRDGRLTAWEFHNYNSGPAAIRTPYEVAHRTILFHPVSSPLRQGSYRALAATANHFARETHLDELAHALSLDPLAFRLKNLQDPRLRAVFEAAAERFGWGLRPPGLRRGFGLAGGVEKGGYVAACAEVEAARGEAVRLRRLVLAFECGAVVNPDGLRNQIEGALVQGIGGALFEAVRFGGGQILNSSFSGYRVPRFTDLPTIELVVLDRRDLPPAGAGETPIVAVAPAVGNAIFDATGLRLRGLPLVPERLPRA
jgi:nicotinate dehydrogenase subunit B